MKMTEFHSIKRYKIIFGILTGVNVDSNEVVITYFKSIINT